jgi:hypothetical protein
MCRFLKESIDQTIQGSLKIYIREARHEKNPPSPMLTVPRSPAGVFC